MLATLRKTRATSSSSRGRRKPDVLAGGMVRFHFRRRFPQPQIWTRPAGRDSTSVPARKTVPGGACHLPCIEATHLPQPPTGSLCSPSPRLRTAAARPPPPRQGKPSARASLFTRLASLAPPRPLCLLACFVFLLAGLQVRVRGPPERKTILDRARWFKRGPVRKRRAPNETDGTMDEKTYNGWTNYETWAVALWIDNEQSSYHYWRDEARRHRKDAPASQQVQNETWNAEQAARFNLADQLKEEFNDAAPLAEPNVYSDLLGAALSEVNWSEIAEHMLADLEEEEQTDLVQGEHPVLWSGHLRVHPRPGRQGRRACRCNRDGSGSRHQAPHGVDGCRLGRLRQCSRGGRMSGRARSALGHSQYVPLCGQTVDRRK